MAHGPLFKVKHHSGRILGPLDLDRVRLLILKNQIDGTEIARPYPDGEWKDINQLPDIAELLFRHARGDLAKKSDTHSALRSAQSSYRPILGETVVIPGPPEPEAPVEIELEKPAPKSASKAKTETGPDDERTLHHASEEDDSKTIMRENVDLEDDRTQMTSAPIALDDGSEDGGLPVELANPGKISSEPTIMMRTEKSPAKKKRKFRVPSVAEIIRIVVIAGALGYFGYDTFLADEAKTTKAILKKISNFRPMLPQAGDGKPDPALSQKIYLDAARFYVLDHVQGYQAAAGRYLRAAAVDPNNVKALAMLASSYINLIDTSNKDESYFGVISKLIEMSKAKNVDLPETVIADAEFFTITGRPEAALARINEYTKDHAPFDVVMYFYVAQALYAKGDYGAAARAIAEYPDNKAFSAKVFYLRGLIAEKLGDSQAAFREYAKALTMNPQHSLSRLRKVSLSAREGRLKEVAAEIELIVNHPDLLSPKDLAEAYFYYGQYLQIQGRNDLALSAFERAVVLDRGSHEYLLEYYTLKARSGDLSESAKQDAKMYFFLGEGEKKLKEGYTDEALTQFLYAKEANPTSYVPYYRIGELFVRKNDMVNARLNLKKAAEMRPNSIEVWSKYIHVLIQSYEWDDAQKAMDKFRSLPVSQSSIDKLAGDMYAKQNRHVEAQTFYKKAMMRESIDPDVYIAYADSLMATQRYKDAPFFYALARRFDPLSAEAIVGTAKAIANSEGIDTGTRYLQDELRRVSAPRAELFSALADLEMQRGEWVAAQRYVEQAKDANPDYAYPWKQQAQIYLNSEHSNKKALDKALDAFKSYSDRNTSDPSGYLERYKLFVKKALFEQAGGELDRIYAIYPKYPNLHYFKGIMYRVMGNRKVAAEEFKSELENNPNHIQALVDYGVELMELGDAKNALTFITKAMQIDPTSSAAKFQAANANKALRNYAGAIALYRSAAAIDTGNPLIYRKMGDCYREMGDPGNARQSYKKYLEMEPDAQDRSEIENYL